jgi:hypothetical protein
LSLTLFEKTPILNLFQHLDDDFDSADNVNQLKLLDI